jgi:hypothetical protein
VSDRRRRRTCGGGGDHNEEDADDGKYREVLSPEQPVTLFFHYPDVVGPKHMPAHT